MTRLTKKLTSITAGILATGALAFGSGSASAQATFDLATGDGLFDNDPDVTVSQISGIARLGGSMWPVMNLGGGAGMEVFLIDWSLIGGTPVGPVAFPGPGETSFFTVYVLPLTFNTADPLDGWTYDVGGAAVTFYDSDGIVTGGRDFSTRLITQTVNGFGTTNSSPPAAVTGGFNGDQNGIRVTAAGPASGVAAGFITNADGVDVSTLGAALTTKVTTSGITQHGPLSAAGCAAMAGDPMMTAIDGAIVEIGIAAALAGCSDGGLFLQSGPAPGFAFANTTINFTVPSPEPGTLALLGLGLVGLGVSARRRKSA